MDKKLVEKKGKQEKEKKSNNPYDGYQREELEFLITNFVENSKIKSLNSLRGSLGGMVTVGVTIMGILTSIILNDLKDGEVESARVFSTSLTILIFSILLITTASFLCLVYVMRKIDKLQELDDEEIKNMKSALHKKYKK